MSVCSVAPHHTISAHRCLTSLVCKLGRQQDFAGGLECIVGVLGQRARCLGSCLDVISGAGEVRLACT